MNAPRVLVSSGELSGDQRLSELLRALRAQVPKLRAEGIGPTADVSALAERGDVAMMGFDRLGQVAMQLWRARQALLRAADTGTYTGAVVVDYSGFNIPLGRALRRRGLPVVYYVPPKLWAWGAWRVPKLKQAADVLVTTMPFEDTWFRERGFETIYAGHPAQDNFVDRPSREAARVELGIDLSARVLLLMPGSRQGEIDRHMPVLRRALQNPELTRYADCVLVPVAQARFREPLREALAHSVVPVHWAAVATSREYCAADFAWIASGTANLEAAWCGLPAAVFYRTGATTFALGRRLVQVKCLSPVNLWKQQILYPEFLQHAMTDAALLNWIRTQDHAAVRAQLRQHFVPQAPIVPTLAQKIKPWLKLP